MAERLDVPWFYSEPMKLHLRQQFVEDSDEFRQERQRELTVVNSLTNSWIVLLWALLDQTRMVGDMVLLETLYPTYQVYIEHARRHPTSQVLRPFASDQNGLRMTHRFLVQLQNRGIILVDAYDPALFPHCWITLMWRWNHLHAALLQPRPYNIN